MPSKPCPKTYQSQNQNQVFHGKQQQQPPHHQHQSVCRTFSTPCSEGGHQLDNLDEEDEEDDQEEVTAVQKNQTFSNSENNSGGGRKSCLVSKSNICPETGHGGNGQLTGQQRMNYYVNNDGDDGSLDGQSHILLDEFSVELPSDFPSGLVDIEGNIIGNVRLGQEDDDEDDDENEEDDGEDEHNVYRHHRLSFGDYEVDHEGGNGKLMQGQCSGDLEDDEGRKLSVISNGQVFTHGRGYHLHNHCHRHKGVGRDNSTSAQSNNSSASTITQHYYPEGGWGWVVLVTAVLSNALMCGMNLCAGLIIWAIMGRFGSESKHEAGWLGATSVGISLLFSPIWVSICKRKSTRLAAVFGGLVAALGCLFTSFATQLHQVYFSYATILGVGVGLTRDASSLMVGQYFKRKRDMVEIIVVAASGLGILLMSILINNAINSFGWRLGLQAVTGCLFICFFLGTCYRSASLYHPQRRAILHLKNQKRKIKDKEKRDDRPPFVDCSCLRSKTVQILLLSSATSAFGIYTPIFYLAIDFHENLDEQLTEHVNMSLVYVYVGVAWMLGCLIFGILIVQKSKDCRVSKQYLCQVAGVICSISIVALTIAKGQSGLIIFCCIYGFSLGGYNYALKIHTYERVRARHFPRAWSFIQSSQAIPLFLGVPITGYINDYFPGWRAGYYLSAAMVFLGSLFLFLTDVRKRQLSRRKSQNSSTKTCETLIEKTESPKLGRLSFAFPVEQLSSDSKQAPASTNSDQHFDLKENMGDDMEASVLVKELTCISEEAMADMNFQDIYYEEWEDFFGHGCITSCNKVEACLASEFQSDSSTIFQKEETKKMRLLQTIPSRPGFHLHGGLVGTAAAVAHGVASMGMGSPALTPQQLESSSHENTESHLCSTHNSKPINKDHNIIIEQDSTMLDNTGSVQRFTKDGNVDALPSHAILYPTT